MENKDVQYMQLAYLEANKAKGFQLPNPKVGAVLVQNDEVIGVGYHEIFGKEHAEVNAINDAEKKGKDVKGATLYVTLMPCSREGNTGSCAHLIVEKKIKKVVVGFEDVTDDGAINLFKENKVELVTGVLAEKCKYLVRDFSFYQRSIRPFITVKAAMSVDGYIATRDNESKWITSEGARAFTKDYRKNYQALLIGHTTLKEDDPELLGINGNHNPVVVIFAPTLKDIKKYRLAETPNKKIIFTSVPWQDTETIKYIEVDKKKPIDLKWAVEKLFNEYGIKTMLVEGGSITVGRFLRAKLVDEIQMVVGNKLFGDIRSKNAFIFQSMSKLSDAVELNLLNAKRISNNVFKEYEVLDVHGNNQNKK